MRTEANTLAIGHGVMPGTKNPHAPVPLSLHAVNGWRGPGAIGIAFAHVCIALDFLSADTLLPITLLVDFFFVLSGILIAQAYTERLSRVSAIPEYIVRRFGRIWPVHVVTLAALVAYEFVKLGAQSFYGVHFSIPAFASEGINQVRAIWSNLLLIHSLGIHDRETWNFPSWSLSVEFFTYVIFAAFCLVRPVTRRVASVVTIALAIAILATVAPVHMRSTYDYGIFRCMAAFFAGTLCYDAIRSTRLPAWPLPTLVEVAAIVLIGIWISRSVDTYLAFATPLVICLFAVVYLPARGLVSRLLMTKPFQFLAELSFTIYMVHALVVFGLITLLHVVERSTGIPLFVKAINPYASSTGFNTTVQVLHIDSLAAKLAIVIGYFAVVFILAYATYRLVEIPGRILFGNLAKRLNPRVHSTPQPAIGALDQAEPSA